MTLLLLLLSCLKVIASLVEKSTERDRFPDANSIIGSQGIVRFFTTWERNFAVKKFNNQEDYEREVGILQLVRGVPNILQPLVAVDESLELVFPHIKGGDLLKLDPRKLYYDNLVTMCKGMVKALGAIHRAGYLHMDVKPENILHDGLLVYLIDFGLAIPIGEAQREVGTPRTMAPEVLFPKEYSFPLTRAADWWSLGVTIFNLFSRFYELESRMQYNNFPYEVVYEKGRAVRVRWPSLTPLHFPEPLRDFLYGPFGLLSVSYSARDWESTELLKHSFFK